MALPSSLATATFSLPSVQCNTSGVCQPTDSRLDSAKKQRKVLSLENSLKHDSYPLKRKANFSSNVRDHKQPGFDSSRSITGTLVKTDQSFPHHYSTDGMVMTTSQTQALMGRSFRGNRRKG